MSQFEVIGTPAMRVLKRYAMPFSVCSVPRTTLSNVEGEWAVKAPASEKHLYMDTHYRIVIYVLSLTNPF
jgi:hypothetical protein